MQLTWKAIYDDGKSLSQYNENGTENFYKDIQRHKLVRFDLIDSSKKPIYSVYLRDGQRLIFRRRNFIKISPQGEERHMIYLVGWQMAIVTQGGLKNIIAINYIYEDGSIALDGARDNLELIEEEK